MAVNVDVVRVFTRGESGGNHLGIVTDIASLDSAAMQAIATEVGYSETAFLDPTPAMPRVRIFTPFAELPFAGHPLVGAAWYLAHRFNARRSLRVSIGEVRCGTVGDRAWIETQLDQPVIDFAGRYPSWMPNPISIKVVEMPIPYVMWELATADDVASIEEGKSDLWIYAFAHEGAKVRARFFVGDEFEDPATGSAAVALAARLGADERDSGELLIHQGEEIGHPSTIHLSWMQRRARIAGTVHEEPSRAAG